MLKTVYNLSMYWFLSEKILTLLIGRYKSLKRIYILIVSINEKRHFEKNIIYSDFSDKPEYVFARKKW